MIEDNTILKQDAIRPSLSRVLASGWTRALVAVVVLGVLVASKRIDLGVFREVRDGWPWLVAASVLMLPPYLIVSVRFWLVLRNQGLHVSYASALRWTMVGSFFDVVMPSSSGGDIVKASYVMSAINTGSRTQGLMAVVFDRALGLLGLFLLAGITGVFGWELVVAMPGGKKILEFSVLVCFGALLGLRIVGSSWLLTNSCMNGFFEGAPLGRHLEGFLRCFNALCKQPITLCGVLLLSVLNHAFLCLSLLCITAAFFISPPPILGFVVFPLAIFSNVFGFAGGFGVGTAAFDLIFSKLLNIPVGATIGITFQILTVLSRLTGLPWVLTGRGTPVDIRAKRATET